MAEEETIDPIIASISETLQRFNEETEPEFLHAIMQQFRKKMTDDQSYHTVAVIQELSDRIFEQLTNDEVPEDKGARLLRSMCLVSPSPSESPCRAPPLPRAAVHPCL